jgi:hypothetical protein
MNRKFRRNAGREQSKIRREFWTVVDAFHKYTGDVPDGVANESYLAKRFNTAWIQFCDHWDKSPHMLKPDRRAFINYVTGQTDPVIETE